jgi:hypothetical protein
LLLVDGHNSHYTYNFIQHAHTHHIDVLCYPSHSTHLFQGLDVVVFGVLKQCWSEARDTFKREHGVKVTKKNFMKVYAEAHLKALTKENILATFRKTGIVPFNPNVITEEMLAPSWTLSIEGPLPLPTEEPMSILTNMICGVVAHHTDSPETDTVPAKTITRTMTSMPIQCATSALKTTSASFLVTPETPKSTMRIPRYCPYTISPKKDRYLHLVEREPETEAESQLRDALKESEARDCRRKCAMTEMQANVVLQSL